MTVDCNVGVPSPALSIYTEGSWEPSTQNVIQSMLRWMMTYPTPRWEVSDSGRYYTSAEVLDFPNRGGIGLSVVPGEAHRLLGNEESAIGVAKNILVFFEKGHRFPSPVFTMAAGAMNAYVGPSSFSAYQLAFGHGGGILDDEKLLEGVDVRKAFDKMVKERERASIAFEKERAAERV